jgi:hypothetical protein
MKKVVLFIQGGGEGAHEADGMLAASLQKPWVRNTGALSEMPHEESPEFRRGRLLATEIAASNMTSFW